MKSFWSVQALDRLGGIPEETSPELEPTFVGPWIFLLVRVSRILLPSSAPLSLEGSSTQPPRSQGFLRENMASPCWILSCSECAKVFGGELWGGGKGVVSFRKSDGQNTVCPGPQGALFWTAFVSLGWTSLCSNATRMVAEVLCQSYGQSFAWDTIPSL